MLSGQWSPLAPSIVLDATDSQYGHDSTLSCSTGSPISSYCMGELCFLFHFPFKGMGKSHYSHILTYFFVWLDRTEVERKYKGECAKLTMGWIGTHADMWSGGSGLRRPHASNPKQFGRVCACIMTTLWSVSLFWTSIRVVRAHTFFFLETNRSSEPKSTPLRWWLVKVGILQ